MWRKLKVWWIILTGVGSGMRLGRQVDQLFRYYVLETLAEEGIFNFLQQPRTYGQILTEFGLVDSEYTRELFKILASDRRNLVIEEGGQYRLNSNESLPQLDKIVRGTDKRIHNFSLMAKGMTRYILPRLRDEPIEFSETFEWDGRQLLTKFDKTLGSRIYSTIRQAAFALLTPEERVRLHGKKLLDIGCGSGRETAELWCYLDGKVQITAVDPVASLLEIAEQTFPVLLDEIDLTHPPLGPENRPVFKEASATRLPFPDNTFDAAFHSLVLHWTPDPEKAISEIVRVLKPGGLVFGTQGTKPYLNPYFDIVIRTSENSYGFFWREEFRRWYEEQGVRLEILTPVGVFYGHKQSGFASERDETRRSGSI